MVFDFRRWFVNRHTTKGTAAISAAIAIAAITAIYRYGRFQANLNSQATWGLLWD